MRPLRTRLEALEAQLGADGAAPAPVRGLADLAAVVGQGRAPLEDPTGEIAAVFRGLPDGELEALLEALDASPDRLLELYARVRERAVRTRPLHVTPAEAFRWYEFLVYDRDPFFPTARRGSVRQQWAMILDVPLQELTDGKPIPDRGPEIPYRVLADASVSEESYQRAVVVMLWSCRRRRCPLDRYGVGGLPESRGSGRTQGTRSPST